MAKFLPFKIKWNKYKNPFKVKLFIFCMLAVPVFCFLVYGVYANLGGLLLSFQNFSRTQEKVIPVGFENYKRFFSLFKRFDYGRMIGVSFGYFAVVMLISIPISITVAFFLYKKIPFGRLIVVVLFLPNIIPMSLLAEYYRQLFDPINGVLNKFLNIILGYTAETAPSYLSDPAYANQMLYIYTVWFGFGYNSILIWGAMSRIPKDLVESAQLDGANLFVEFFRITIPVIWSTLTMVLVLHGAVHDLHATAYNRVQRSGADHHNIAVGDTATHRRPVLFRRNKRADSLRVYSYRTDSEETA